MGSLLNCAMCTNILVTGIALKSNRCVDIAGTSADNPN